MDKNELLIKYYETQRNILMLLEETDLIVEQLVNDTKNNTKTANTYYMLRHSDKNNALSETHYKYIQVGPSGRPQIITRTGYRANRNVLFKTKEDAAEFLMKFITSKSRRRCIAPNYFKIVEKVVKHTPVLKSDVEYGEYYM